jgi:hypothetical protein
MTPAFERPTHSAAFAEDPQVGHGTAEICLGVSSLFFIKKKCYDTTRSSVQYCTLPTKKGNCARNVPDVDRKVAMIPPGSVTA